MKKSLIALAVIVMFATTSFASVSFLTAPGIGQGKIALLGLYATSHNGDTGGAGDPSATDVTALGIRVAYGLMKDLDLLAAYSMDSYANLKDGDIPSKLASANTTNLGVKYTVIKDGANVNGVNIPMDVAIAGGIETSVSNVKIDAGGGTAMGVSSMVIGAVMSKKINNMVPYGAIALKSLKLNQGNWGAGGNYETSGTSLALNIGLMYGIAANQAVAIEYNTENQSFGDFSARGKNVKDTAFSQSVSGISLGYVYMF